MYRGMHSGIYVWFMYCGMYGGIDYGIYLDLPVIVDWFALLL